MSWLKLPIFLRLSHCAVSVVMNVSRSRGPSRIHICGASVVSGGASIQFEPRSCSFTPNVVEGLFDQFVGSGRVEP